MLESVIAIAVGVAIAFAWLAIWVVVLRAFGIPVLTRTPEEQAVKKQHILQMGKLRYILIFGVLGNGFALGLGIAIAIAVIMKRGSANWGEAATIFGVVSLVTGCINGMRTWSDLFRKGVPFPPLYSPPK